MACLPQQFLAIARDPDVSLVTSASARIQITRRSSVTQMMQIGLHVLEAEVLSQASLRAQRRFSRLGAWPVSKPQLFFCRVEPVVEVSSRCCPAFDMSTFPA